MYLHSSKWKGQISNIYFACVKRA